LTSTKAKMHQETRLCCNGGIIPSSWIEDVMIFSPYCGIVVECMVAYRE
jgi:hypothetical protein